MDEDITGISRVGIMEASMLPLVRGNGIALLQSGITLKHGGPPSMGMAILPTKISLTSLLGLLGSLSTSSGCVDINSLNISPTVPKS